MSLLDDYFPSRINNAVMGWLNLRVFCVVDVHGSIMHRTAIQEGLARSNCDHFAVPWLHEPLAEVAGKRIYHHAGGVETALVHLGASTILNDWLK